MTNFTGGRVNRRGANEQQLTCKIGWFCSFCSLFFSLVLFDLEHLVLKENVLGKISEVYLEFLESSENILKRFALYLLPKLVFA